MAGAPIRVAVAGAAGRMGATVCEAWPIVIVMSTRAVWFMAREKAGRWTVALQDWS